MSYSFTKFLLCLDLRKGLFSTAVALGVRLHLFVKMVLVLLPF